MDAADAETKPEKPGSDEQEETVKASSEGGGTDRSSTAATGRPRNLPAVFELPASFSAEDNRPKHALSSFRSSKSNLEEISQLNPVMYKRRRSVIRNPLKPPGPCRPPPNLKKPTAWTLSVRPGPDRPVLTAERQYYLAYRTSNPADRLDPNPTAATPLRARRWTLSSARHAPKVSSCDRCGWAARERRLTDYRDHLLALDLGYETLVGNLLHIDIPGGRDINRSWQNFLSDDPMEWGFPYYKGSRDRPKFKHKEPYLAHQLKEKLWRYPRTRIFFSNPEE